MQKKLIIFLILASLLIWFVLANNTDVVMLKLIKPIKTTPGILTLAAFSLGTIITIIATWITRLSNKSNKKSEQEEVIEDLRAKLNSIESKIDEQKELQHYSEPVSSSTDNQTTIEFEYENKTEPKKNINTFFKE